MTQNTSIHKLFQKIPRFFPLLFITIILFVIAGNRMIVFQKNGNSLPPLPTPTPFPHTTYTSSKLGISFTYKPLIYRQKFFIKEIGNTVYIYRDHLNQEFTGSDDEFLKTKIPQSYSVTVYNKNPRQSLQDAIKEQFLSGYDQNNCFIKPTRVGHPRLDQAYQTAVIAYSRNLANTRTEADALIAKCPKEVVGFMVRYFMMDPKHPNKLLFVDLRQDGIPSGIKGFSWDETITILD